jgi:hypothetical protein
MLIITRKVNRKGDSLSAVEQLTRCKFNSLVDLLPNPEVLAAVTQSKFA